MKTNPDFKVIIVGGGIGGLTLANSLQHAGIDFVLLEGRDQIDPQIGASIGILPNGARILDQIKCFDDLHDLTVSMETSASHREDGSLIGELSDTLKLIERRTGYPVFFLERRSLLQVLAQHILEPDRILLQKSVQHIQQLADKVVVQCVDGTSIEGDIVVGADGVHSSTRREMWRHADEAGDGQMFSEDKNAMSAEYKCIFGISTSIPGMTPGQTDRTHAKDVSTLSYVGKDGIIFWFAFVKLDKVYYPPHIPRYTEEDAAALVHEIGQLPIREHKQVVIDDLYRNRVSCNLVAIEEAAYQHWSYGRITCLGDSIHKMTPNLGAGASSAIESAAVLSNYIVRLASKPDPPSLASLEDAFRQYQDDRMERIGRAMKFSNKLTRVQALNTKRDYIYTHYIAPRTDDFAAEMFSSFVIGASIVDHLPVPAKSTQGTMPFNPQQGWGFEEPKSKRATKALPLLALAFISFLHSRGWLEPLGINRVMFPNSQSTNVLGEPLARSICSDVVYGIWFLEATRLTNKGTFAQFPIIFGMALASMGLDVVAPVYFFILYIQSPIENFRASDSRLTDTSYTSTIGMLVILLSWLPEFASRYSPKAQSLSGRLWPMEWQPLLLSALQFVLAQIMAPSTVRQDRLWAVQRDMPWIRFNIAILTISSTVFQVYRMFVSGSLLTKLHPVEISFAISTVAWLILVFKDLRNAGMVQSRWLAVGALSAALLMLTGPGGLLAIGWLLREETILTQRHKGAVKGDKFMKRD